MREAEIQALCMRPCFATRAKTLRSRDDDDARKKAGIAPGLLLLSVMPGLVPGIHVLATKKVADARVKPGHDACLAQFDARFGGVAGHDLISAS